MEGAARGRSHGRKHSERSPSCRKYKGIGSKGKEEKGDGGYPPERGRKTRIAKTQEGSQDYAKKTGRLGDRRKYARSPARTTGRTRCYDIRKDRPISPKRRRHLSPAARAPEFLPLPKVFNRMGALEEALNELLVPGGAFLQVPARRPQPTASQRAWLSWQLTHAGAALHWALATLDALLVQPCPADPWSFTPAPEWR
ncbi:hypothetical protein TREES_T100003796 [Tupaia chinensis]|uniref:Uncharacterized protein n=1 Tax=Tupaia chinensis TaxID=246437 RepID=L9L6T0_TUPCH|nr:hypothetical protein TREES_T100003796 [Tupaia chinensis]